jgi:Protein of unknown function (DUF3405)
MLRIVRFGYRNMSRMPEVKQWHELKESRRTGIVVRAWRGYEYKAEDMYYLRSLIVEASLKTGGEYQVILLVDMKEYAPNIFATKHAYEQAMVDAGIPPELQSIAVLWDDKLLDSWYPLVTEHR